MAWMSCFMRIMRIDGMSICFRVERKENEWEDLGKRVEGENARYHLLLVTCTCLPLSWLSVLGGGGGLIFSCIEGCDLGIEVLPLDRATIEHHQQSSQETGQAMEEALAPSTQSADVCPHSRDRGAPPCSWSPSQLQSQLQSQSAVTP